jgi:hypothetical protein
MDSPIIAHRSRPLWYCCRSGTVAMLRRSS